MMRNRVWGWCSVTLAVVALFLGTRACRAGESAPATTNAAALTDEQMGEILQGAILLARMGLYDEAEQQCNRILAQDPKQPTVRQLLDEIQAKKSQQGAFTDLRHTLDSTMIRDLNVRDEPVTNVIEILRTESGKVLAKKEAINIVWQVPESSKAAKLTLNLHNIPLADMLKYVTEGAGLRYRVDAHAVVIYKPLPTPSQ